LLYRGGRTKNRKEDLEKPQDLGFKKSTKRGRKIKRKVGSFAIV